MACRTRLPIGSESERGERTNSEVGSLGRVFTSDNKFPRTTTWVISGWLGFVLSLYAGLAVKERFPKKAILRPPRGVFQGMCKLPRSEFLGREALTGHRRFLR